MNTPTLNKSFNKELDKHNVMSGNVFSNIQTSMYVRGIDNKECNGFDFAKGELFTRDFQKISDMVTKRGSLSDDFVEKLHEACSEGDVCVYAFKTPTGNRNISYAISNKSGLIYFEEIGTSEKQKNVNQYILNTLNQNGWF